MSTNAKASKSVGTTLPIAISAVFACFYGCYAAGAASVSITAPVSGETVTPGSSITVTVALNTNHSPISRVAVLSSVVGGLLLAPSYSASFALPPTFSGVLTLIAFAQTNTTVAQSSPVTVLVIPNDTLTSLAVTPSDYTLNALGGTRALRVIGTFAGGETADLTDHRLGTSYESSATNVTSVSLDGLVTAVGNGTAQIIAQNGASQMTIPIMVDAPTTSSPPVANAGPNQTTRPCHTVSLVGGQSYDPNGQALSFAWTQVSGPAVTLSNASSGSPSFIAPPNNSVLQFSLLVTDFVGLSATASTTVNVKACRDDVDRLCREGVTLAQVVGDVSDNPDRVRCHNEHSSHRTPRAKAGAVIAYLP